MGDEVKVAEKEKVGAMDLQNFPLISDLLQTRVEKKALIHVCIVVITTL